MSLSRFWALWSNLHVVDKHSCKQHRVKCKDLLQFRMELVHLLLEDVGRYRGASCSAGGAQSARVCY